MRTENAILIKPASGNCNLRCAYCFYMDEQDHRETASYGFMSVEMLETVIREAIANSERAIRFAWQGGEPTLCGLSFFEEAVRLQKKYNDRGIEITNVLQTNGILLNEEWADFLAKEQFLVGISLDGIPFIHDRFRKMENGQGSYEKVWDVISLLQQHQVAFNVLTVVTPALAKRAKEVYETYQEAKITHMQFIPCILPLSAEACKGANLGAKEYATFLKDLFDLWYQDLLEGTEVKIPQFDEYVGMLQGRCPATCGADGHCSLQYVVEADGSVYPCDFYALDDKRLGKFGINSMEEMDAKREQISFLTEGEILPDSCRSCPYARLCGNGCKRYRETRGNAQVHRLCESYQDFFAYAGNRLALLVKVGYDNTK